MGAGIQRSRAGTVLLSMTLLAALLAITTGHAPVVHVDASSGQAPTVEPANAFVECGAQITIRAERGDRLLVSTGGDDRDAVRSGDVITMRAFPDDRNAARLITTPTAMQWRHPKGTFPTALVVRCSEFTGTSATGPTIMRTFLFEHHGELPVISIQAAEEDLFDPGQGIAVVGDGMLTANAAVLRSYAVDPRWWKYPGNYHGRGKEWERPARMQLIGPDGNEIVQCPVDLRINGQLTRGFPQHAFRLLFDKPLDAALFADGDGLGTRSMVLRAGGNDQVKAMLRDVFQHELCAGLPFETSKALTCVLYLNGAYWGVHHLRQRMDEDELARRYGISPKQITILEDNSQLYRGDPADVGRFNQLMARTEKWDTKDPAWIETLEAQLDVDGFLTYMASQIILGNMDWPIQNVKYWRYTGPPMERAPLDGRWYFIMGDSDLGFGANASAASDPLAKVRSAHVPVSRLFLAMMRSPVLKSRFIAAAEQLNAGPLASDTCLLELDHMVERMAPEMDRHTARWRKPLDKDAWLAEVEVMRRFARERGDHVTEWIEAYSKNP